MLIKHSDYRRKPASCQVCQYFCRRPQYFIHVRQRPDRARIKMEYIEETVRNADYTEVQSDGRIRKWKKIKEQGKFLRVILLSDGVTIHNAFFDRRFKGDRK